MFNLDQRSALIAVLCGLATAALTMAPLVAGFFGMVLGIFAATPLFVAALGFGTGAGLVAGFTSAIATTFFLGPLAAFSLVIVTAGPAIWIGHLAGLVNEEGEWFPASGIFLRMVGISTAIGVVMGSLLMLNTDDLREGLTELMAVIQTQNPELAVAGNTEDFADRVLRLFPPVLTAGLLITFTINLLIAERFSRARGWILRPKEVKAFAVGLPVWAIAVMAIATIIGATTDSTIATTTNAIAGAFGMGFALVGLATVHAFARNFIGGVGLLTVTYGLIILFNFFAFLLLALIGVAETLLGLRSRATPPTPSI
jgi:MFS family permease